MQCINLWWKRPLVGVLTRSLSPGTAPPPVNPMAPHKYQQNRPPYGPPTTGPPPTGPPPAMKPTPPPTGPPMANATPPAPKPDGKFFFCLFSVILTHLIALCLHLWQPVFIFCISVYLFSFCNGWFTLWCGLKGGSSLVWPQQAELNLFWICLLSLQDRLTVVCFSYICMFVEMLDIKLNTPHL